MQATDSNRTGYFDTSKDIVYDNVVRGVQASGIKSIDEVGIKSISYADMNDNGWFLELIILKLDLTF